MQFGGTMNYYLQSTTEQNLYLCLKNGVWGSKNNKIKDWRAGDRIILYVDRKLAALVTLKSDSFVDTKPIWSGDIYRYRVQIELEKIIAPSDRYSISSLDVRETLFEHHGSSYAIGVVLAARPLAAPAVRILLEKISNAPGWEDFNANDALAIQIDKQEAEQANALDDAIEARHDEIETKESGSLHTQMQYNLSSLGKALRYEIWIPKADQGRAYKQTKLDTFSVHELPYLPFSDEVVKVIKNIDVIWLQEGNPTHLFEVEHTTSIYSGLLRMSDLISLIPSLNINMFICASEEKRSKVLAEVNRPTFERRKVPLSKICRFISFERLTEFMTSYQNVLGHFSTSIMDDLSESLRK